MADDDLSDIPRAPQQPAAADDLGDIPRRDTTLQDNYKSASQVAPDHAAKVLSISGKTGMSPAYVSANIKDAEAAAKQPSDDFFDDVQQNFPKSANLLAQVQTMAKVHDDLGNLVAHEDVANKFKNATSYLDALKAGLEGSVFGHIYDRGAPSIGVGPESTYGQHLVSAAVGMAADFPFMVLGGVGATALAAPAGPAAVLAAGPGAFGLPALLKTSIAEYYRTGDATGIRNDLEKTFNVAKETGKQAVVGLITELTGGAMNKATIGAFLPSAEQMAGMTLKQTMAKLFAQNAAMTVAGAGVEGKAPTLTDFSTNAILLGGLEGVHFIGGSMVDRAKAQASQNYVQTLDEMARQSEFRKRDAAGYAAHMNDISDQPARVPIEAFEKLFPNAQAFAERIGVHDSYQEAKATGGDVSIPMGTFLSEPLDSFRSKMTDDVRFDPDSKTANQLKAAEEEAKAKQEQQAQKSEPAPEGPLSGAIGKIKKLLGMEEPAAPAPEQPKPQEPVAAPQMEPVKPETAEQQKASRDAIARAQLDLGQVPQKIEGVDPELAEHHARMEQAALAEAERVMMKPQLDEMSRDVEKERASLEAGARIEIENDPLYQAEAMLEKHLGKNAFTKHAKGDLSEAQENIFQAVAEKYGFDSSDHLSKSLMAAPNREQAIKNLVEDMAPRPIRNTPEFRGEALKAIHNEKMTDLLALKSEILAGMKDSAEKDDAYRAGVRERARIAAADAKTFAYSVIYNKKVGEAGDFRPYYTAERDAALRAYKASQAGDYDGAAKATREQLQAHAIAAESLRARANIEKWTSSIEKMQKLDKDAFKAQEHFDQAAALMFRFGFERPDFQWSQKQETLSDWAKRMNEKTGTVAIPIWLMDERNAVLKYRDMTVPQLHDLSDALKNIKQNANNEEKMWTLQRDEGLSALTEELHAAKEANVEGGKTPGAGTFKSKWDKIIAMKDAARQALVSPETLMLKLDGYKRGGVWSESLIESKARAEDARSEHMTDMAFKWREMHSDYTAKELAEMKSRGIWIPELNSTLTKDNLLTLAANQGSEGNAEKVRSMLGLKDGQRVPVEQSLVDSILKREMSERDWNLVQKRINFASMYRSEMGALYKRLTGFEPEWVKAQPINTPFGVKEGGYYPLIPDPRVTVRGFEEMAEDSALNNPPPVWKAATRNGFIEARNQFARYAVSLDGDGLVRHMSDVVHDLTMREWVLDANRILGSKGVQADIIDALGQNQFQSLKQWVRQIAGNDVKPLRGVIDSISGDLRRRSTIAMLGSKIAVMLSQLHGVTAAAGVDKDFTMKDVAYGMLSTYGEMVHDPASFKAMSDWVDENSSYMKQKARNADRDLSDANKKVFGKNRKDLEFANHGFGLIDEMTTKPIWRQAYRRGLELEEGDHDKAVAYADRIIRNSTVSGRRSDLPEMMRGSELSALATMFHGFIDRQAQLMYRAADQVHGAEDIPKFAGTAMAVMVMPNIVYALTHDVFAAGPDQKKKWEKAAIKSISPFTLIPVVNSLQDMAIDHLLGRRVNASMTPIGGIADALNETMAQATSRKARTQQKVEAAAHLASYAVPYPDQFNRWIFNIADYVNGRMNPQPGDLLQRRPKQQRRK